MTHKGGKKAKKAFHKLKLSSTMKEKIEDLPHSQLALLLVFIRALMASSGRTVRAGKRKAGASHRRLKAGVHSVRVGGRMRKVRVNAKGQWRFMKG